MADLDGISADLNSTVPNFGVLTAEVNNMAVEIEDVARDKRDDENRAFMKEWARMSKEADAVERVKQTMETMEEIEQTPFSQRREVFAKTTSMVGLPCPQILLPLTLIDSVTISEQKSMRASAASQASQMVQQDYGVRRFYD
jgi:hypothetical protein